MFDLMLLPLAAGGDGGLFQGDNVLSLLLFAASLLTVFIGLIMLLMSRKGNIRKIAEMGGGVFIAVIIIALGAGGAIFAFGDRFVGFFFGS